MEIRLSRPCVEDPSRYIAECHLGRKLDIEKLCGILRNAGVMGLKCSVKLGVARYELDEKSVMMYQSGRVDIRRIQDTTEAENVMWEITAMVKDAFSGKTS
ncbi:MAG: hypothetical protein OIN89_00935 [Candidatus Methanoperedens sp.]|jgi:ArsR family metal-binding transcriptional regulator|nr:hypothetical protein [Candidatus Methanoperedens sp.]PKL54598.1 MAG: hypothetical protein CVV36_00925 [Candidatus Methanoperedenaceae archaeon HGW-Methanoperedenaceae-1]